MSAVPSLTGTTLRERERWALGGDGRLQSALRRTTDNLDGRRRRGLDELEDPETLRQTARSLRTAAVARLPELLGRLADRVQAAGGTVFFAADAEEARAHVLGICARRGAKLAVKSKSMVSEEIELGARLAEAGIEALETDLGEWAQQLDGEPPAHILGPAMHKTPADWVRVLGTVGYDGDESAPAMTAFARRTLRDKFHAADVGITGVNLAVAESGTLVIVSNEGNARMSSTVPPVQIALMGMERVVADWAEADLLLALLGRAGAGVSFPTYVSAITGPRRPRERDGPQELHLVVLDNGRSRILAGASREALNCIRCGACLNACPVYRQIGGHAYGSVYSGPIGAVISPLLLDDVPEAAELSHASSLCGACWAACPVGIPLHELLLEGRRREAAGGGDRAERAAWRAWAQAWSHPRLYGLTGAPARARIPERLLPPPLREWARGRTVPHRAGATFRARWRRGEVLE
ncbi:MAG: lactate utilization protein [Solirubrobacterales bacterium]|nr:lactate utilization protein [Solirubrobacterales bacterium]MBV9716420.1 lactate utilization protein [Solirubrobacterales bacterium]